MARGGADVEQAKNSKNRMFLLVAALMAIIGLLLVIVGVAGDRWITIGKDPPEGTEYKFEYGLNNDNNGELWCYYLDGHSNEKKGCSYLATVMAMCVLGILSAAGGVALALGYLVEGKNSLMQIVGAHELIMAGVLIMIGITTFASESAAFREFFKEDEYQLGWSFGLTAFGGVLFLAAGLLMIVSYLFC